MVSTCKISFLVEMGTLRYLNKYLFRERKYKNILERDALKIYMHYSLCLMGIS